MTSIVDAERDALLFINATDGVRFAERRGLAPETRLVAPRVQHEAVNPIATFRVADEPRPRPQRA